jgi:diadenosine tetraphosphate (Ap4A) HIT family hydrolase
MRLAPMSATRLAPTVMSDIDTEYSAIGQGCFLCEPPPDLIFYESADFLGIAGLGPIGDGYCLMAATQHVKSMADLPTSLRPQRDDLVRKFRDRLSRKYGSCLITEHGRMELCDDENGDHDAHCFHAHFLLFPGARDISAKARSYFAEAQTFANLNPALSYASASEYMLVSPDPSIYTILSRPLNIPRRLARILVTHDTGSLYLADWRDHPNRQLAQANAADLRILMSDVT